LDRIHHALYERCAADIGRDVAPYQSAKVAPTALRVDQEKPASEPVTAEQLRLEIIAEMGELGIPLTEPTEPSTDERGR
jgi:hypothetical protein